MCPPSYNHCPDPMGLLDDLADFASDAFDLARFATREIVAAQVRERAREAMLSGAIQVGIIALVVWWGHSNDWSWWSRFASTVTFGLIVAWNFLRTVFITIPELRKWMSGWRRLWLDLCGVSLASELFARNAGAVAVIVLLVAGRSSLGWQIPLLLLS